MATELRGKTVLLVGASSQVGYFLLPRLCHAGMRTLAVSRSQLGPQRQPLPAVRWLHPDGLAPELPSLAHVISAGPLPLVVDWIKAIAEPRAVAVTSSSSVLSKLDSPVPGERAQLEAMVEAEQWLLEDAARRGYRLTILQPTLIYGCGLDHNLSVLAR